MNNRELYLAWMRTQAPDLYVSALRKITGKTRSLGGLGDDLIDTAFSPDTTSSTDTSSSLFDVSQVITSNPDASFSVVPPGSYSTPIPTITTPDVVVTATPEQVAAAAAGASGGWFNSFLNAVTQIGTTVIKTQAQSSLINTNTQRARAGLPPVDQYGRPITSAGLGPTSAAIAAMERAIAGSGGIGGVFLIGALAIGALLLFSGGGKGRRR